VPRIHFRAILTEIQVVRVVTADPLQHRRARMPAKLRQRVVVLTIRRAVESGCYTA
jgi:hypothetical protein